MGATVTGVEAAGKNLLIRFDNGLEVRTHLRMRGSWHRYRPGRALAPRAVAGAARARGPGRRRRLLRRADGRAVRAAGRVAAPDPVAARPGPAQAPSRRRRGGPSPARPVAGRRRRSPSRCSTSGRSPASATRCKNETLWVGEAIAVDAGRGGRRRRAPPADRRLAREQLADRRRDRAGGRATSTARAGRPCRRCGTLIRVVEQGERPPAPDLLVPGLPGRPEDPHDAPIEVACLPPADGWTCVVDGRRRRRPTHATTVTRRATPTSPASRPPPTDPTRPRPALVRVPARARAEGPRSCARST